MKVSEIAKVIPKSRGGGRSDNVAGRLRRKGAKAAIMAGAWHVERADAYRFLPAFKRHEESHGNA